MCWLSPSPAPCWVPRDRRVPERQTADSLLLPEAKFMTWNCLFLRQRNWPLLLLVPLPFGSNLCGSSRSCSCLAAGLAA